MSAACLQHAAVDEAIPMTPAEILAAFPQQEPFRFVDAILEIDVDHVMAVNRFDPGADFYRGHFPGNPITPGVILVESMAQCALVPLGIHLLSSEIPRSQLDQYVTLFTDADVDFQGMVRPGERVLVRGRKRFFRRRKLCCEVEMTGETGAVRCQGVLSGMVVSR